MTKDKPFTLIYRDLTTNMTGWHHVLGEDLGTASETFEAEADGVDVELIGAFEGHVTPLWWEE
jgi:hypothetical protein